MGYYAEWCVFIPGDDMDPFEVARQARERVNDPGNNAWRIVDMNNVEAWVIDLNSGRIIMDRPQNKRCKKSDQDASQKAKKIA